MVGTFLGLESCRDPSTSRGARPGRDDRLGEPLSWKVGSAQPGMAVLCGLEGGVVAVGGGGAGLAEGAAVLEDFAFEVDAFTALGADDAGAFEARKIFGADFNFDPLFVEEDVVGKLGVGFLLAVFFVELGEKFAGGLLGRFFGGDADCASGLQIAEGGGDFSPVAEFQGAFAEAAIGNECDGVGDAAVDFSEGDDAFAFGDGIGDAEFAKAVKGEADAEDLSGTEMAVGDGGEFEIFGKRFHGDWIQWQPLR